MKKLTQTELEKILQENENRLGSKNSVYNDSQMPLDGVVPFVETDLTELKDLDLSGLTFAKRNVREIKLVNVRLTDADLRESCLSLAHTEWLNVDLHGADLTCALLHDVKMENVDFSETLLNEAEIHYISGNNLTFRKAQMDKIGFAKAFMQNSIFDEAVMTEANLRRTTFINCSFKHCNLQNADLSFSKFTNADLRFADFTGADCSAIKANIVRVFGAKGLKYLHQARDRQIEYFDVSKDGDGSRMLDSSEMTFYIANPNAFDEHYFRANQMEVFSDEAAAKAIERIQQSHQH